MPLPTPRRVVVGATAHADITRAIRSARPDLETRGNGYTELTTADLEWGDTYVGFRRPPLPTMGNIRWVHCTGAGVDSWLAPVELPRDILLTRTSEAFGPMIAEWALARALAFTQQIVDLADRQRERQWAPRDVSFIRGTRVVVAGTGDIGASIGRVFRALGAHVSGVSRSGKGDPTVFDRVLPTSALAEAASNADWFILALPLTDETRGLVDRRVLSACNGAVLLNAGRGAVVDERVIPEALDNGWIRGAALDVFETEPLPASSPLWADPRVMISPHISGLTTVEGAVTGFLECLAEIERGQLPSRTVDRDRQY